MLAATTHEELEAQDGLSEERPGQELEIVGDRVGISRPDECHRAGGDGPAVASNCSPAVVDGTVVVGEETGLRAVDACSGESEWQVDVTDADGRAYGVFASPVVADETVYALATYTGHDVAGMALAFDANTGEQVWKTPVDYGVQFPEPVVTADALVVPTWPNGPGGTYVIDRTDGSIRRELAVGGATVVVDSHLIVSHPDGIDDFAVTADG